MFSKSLLLPVLAMFLVLTACNQGMQFANSPEQKYNKMDISDVGNETPVDIVDAELDPTPIVPPVIPPVLPNVGEVPPDENVQLPPPPLVVNPPPPVCKPVPTGAVVGQKGSMLLEILERGCNTRQHHERVGYVPPTREQLLEKLNRCGSNIYKSTEFTSDRQKNTVLGMMGDDPALINKMWRGLYYTPPYSDYFELYFGLEIGEAREFFCYDGQMFAGNLLTTEYYSYANHDQLWAWENNSEAQARDHAVQKIRSQLIGCIQQSMYNPADVTTVGDDTDTRNRKQCTP